MMPAQDTVGSRVAALARDYLVTTGTVSAALSARSPSPMV
jgi:hypothetical protein